MTSKVSSARLSHILIHWQLMHPDNEALFEGALLMLLLLSSPGKKKKKIRESCDSSPDKTMDIEQHYIRGSKERYRRANRE